MDKVWTAPVKATVIFAAVCAIGTPICIGIGWQTLRVGERQVEIAEEQRRERRAQQGPPTPMQLGAAVTINYTPFVVASAFSLLSICALVGMLFYLKRGVPPIPKELEPARRELLSRLAQAKADMQKEKIEVKDELWGLTVEYIKMLRRWPNQQSVQEPFILQWRPSVGETEYGHDIAAVMSWFERMRLWKVKAEGRLDGISELELVSALSNRNHVHQHPLGALLLLLTAFRHVDIVSSLEVP